MSKSKGSQRTKGNVKPSSSGHTAELLGSNSKSGFIGFGSCKVGQHVAHADNNLDSTFTMVMKKMLKKDAVTKLKAVQEFRDLCKEKDKDAVLSIITFWPRLYNKLALDNDRRIREATHEANAELIAKVNRDIAPFLKTMMGVWLLAQNDLYPPAASVATSTFVTTFPPEKQSEALMFCKDDIIPYFKDNLFEQTAQSLSEPNTTAEEIEQKFVLVISGTLQGLKLFLQTVSDEARTTLVEDVKAIVTHPKFWKILKNKNSQISVAWYSLISVLCHHMPNVFRPNETKLGSCVLSHLSESDAAVAHAIWEAALHFVVGFENCWDNIDVHKVVLPELWTLLKDGGRGNASILFPCLLPFLSKLPLDTIGDKQKFFDRFFSSLTDSLFLGVVKKSTLECNAIVTAYMECLQYVIRHCKSNEAQIVQKLLCNQLLPLVKTSFTSDGLHLPVSKFYPLLGAFIQHHESSDENFISFWKGLKTMCESVINGERLPRHSDLVFLAYFFHCLYEPSNCLQKKSRVKFSDIDDDVAMSAEKSAESSPESRRELLLFTTDISVLVCRKLDADPEPHLMKLFLEILSSGYSCELFKGIITELKSTECLAEESPFLFFQLIVIPWLKEANYTTIFLETIVEIIFVTCSCLGQDFVDKVLNHCCQVNNPKFQEQLLRRIMMAGNEDNMFRKKINNSELSSSVVGLFKFISGMLISIDKTEAMVSLESYFSTLQTYLKQSTSQDFLIDKSHVEEILTVVHASFEIANSRLHELTEVDMNILEFMCDVTDNIFARYDECWHFSITDTLMMMFLRYSLDEPHCFHESLNQRVNSLWKICCSKLTALHSEQQENQAFFDQITGHFHDLFLHPSNKEKAAQLVECIYDFLQIIESVFSINYNADYEGVVPSYLPSTLLCKILPSCEEWTEMQKSVQLSLLSEFLKKKLFYPLPDIEVDLKRNETIPDHIHAAHTVSHVLMKCMSITTVGQGNKLTSTALQQLPYLLWTFSFSDTHGYLSKKDAEEYSWASKLQKNCFKIISFLSKSNAVALIHTLSEMSVESPSQWLLPFKNVVDIVTSQYHLDPSILYCLYHQLSDDDDLGNQLTCQILITYLPKVSKLDLVQPLILEILTSYEGTWYLHSLARICCCIQQNDVFMSTEIQMDVPRMLTKVLYNISSVNLPSSDYMLACSQVHVFITEVIKNCPDVAIKYLPEILKFSKISLPLCRKVDSCTDAVSLIHANHCCVMICNLLLLISEENSAAEKQTSSTSLSAFLSDVCENLMATFDVTSGSSSVLPDIVKDFLSTLSAAIELLPSKILFNSIVSAASSTTASDFLNTTLKTKFLPLLQSKVLPFQLTAHSILFKIMPLVPELLRNEITSDENDIDDDDDEEGKPIKLVSVVDSLRALTEIVESMLMDFKIDECCIVVPETDSYIYTMAFLFAWSELLELFSASSSQERSDYAAHLECKGLLSTFLSCIFRLLPENLAQIWPSEYSSRTKDSFKNIFMQPPALSPLDPPTAPDLQHLACNIYYSILKKMPAVVRMWYHGLGKRSSEAVNRFTTKYVSSLLASRELQYVHENNLQLTNMSVLAYPAAREVVATYSVENNDIELMIQLPTNYPLGNLTIEKQGNVKLNPLKWRQSLTQLTSFLTYQNGSILDGLLLWKKNLDKTFEGVEECLICFFIINSSSCELPKKSCPGCKKKFHSSCIHKWFVTSNTHACPMCRQLWVFAK